MDTIALLRRLSEAEGISGHEDSVRNIIREIWDPLVDETFVLGLGSLAAVKRGHGAGERPKLMLAAHMDEIGLRVAGFQNGFLRIARVAGMDLRVLLGQEVIVHGQQDRPGLIATRPPHVLPQEEREQFPGWQDVYVDTGLAEDELQAMVNVGNLVSLRSEFVELENERAAGKAMDDRSCVASVTLALRQLAHVRHEWDVYAVATAQEETGLKGALTSAFGIEPDLAIALDVTQGDQPGAKDFETVPFGEGPALGVGPNFHPILLEEMKTVAQAHEIPYTIEPVPGRSGTDAWAIQLSREGVPTALVSIPLRYMHQPVEMLAVKDVERAGRLLAAFVQELDRDFLDRLAFENEAR